MISVEDSDAQLNLRILAGHCAAISREVLFRGDSGGGIRSSAARASDPNILARAVSGDGTGGGWLAWLGISARREDRKGSTISDSVVASARAVCAIRGHAAGDLNRPNPPFLLANTDVDLTRDTPFRAAMLTRIPRAFTLELDASAVDPEMSWTLEPPDGMLAASVL